MMKHFGILFLIMVCVVAMSVVAQTSNNVNPSKGDEIERQYPIAPGVWYPGDPVPEKAFRYYRIRCWPGCHSYGEFADPKNMKKWKVERQYPIAPGVWYPGDPVPEKAFRYYRIRCWPGCHHGGSPYAKYPDKPANAATEGSK